MLKTAATVLIWPLSMLATVACTTSFTVQAPESARVIPLNYLPALSGDYFEQKSKETDGDKNTYKATAQPTRSRAAIGGSCKSYL